MTSYILVFAAQEIYAACVMIWNVLPPSRPPTVFRFSADQINVFIRCTFFGSRSPSAVHRRPLIMGCSALLSVVSQLLSVCNPADSLVRLQRGATPVAACLQAPAERLQSRCSSFADVRKQIVRLSGPPEYYRPRWRRCAPSASCSFGNRLPCTLSTMQGLPKVRYVTRPASCSHPGMFAVPVARRHRIPFSL